MASNAVNTGDAGQLVIVGNEVNYSVSGNWSDISWAVYLNERTEYNYSFGSVYAWVGAVVNGADQGSLGSNTVGFDWRGGGLQSTLIASGTTRFNHNPDGTSSVYLAGHMGSTGTAGAGGPADVGAWIAVTTLKQKPNVPSGVSAARVSDTQGTVSWTNSGASNGKADSNQVYASVDGGAFSKILDIAATSSTNVTLSANHKYIYNVSAKNSAGTTAVSANTAPIFTTPGAPANAVATKQNNLDIIVTWTPNVNYSEHVHEVWHGTVSGGVTTWDGAALASVASGTSTYTHAAPNASQVHVYQVRAKTSSGTVLYSTYAVSNPVQLLVAPNKPTIPSMPAYADRALVLVISWVHNPQDTTTQSAYEFAYSFDGGTTWTSTGKIPGNANSLSIPAGQAANSTLTVRVRTWGAATTGGSDGAGASPWSDTKSVTYKTAPTTTISSPADGAALNDASLKVSLAFAQAESATFVKAVIQVLQGGPVLEEKETTTLLNTQMATVLQNGQAYTVRARVQDSNGLWSGWSTNVFTVTYLPPVPAGAVVTFLPDTGFGQIDLTIPAPGGGQSAAATVTITRSIDGGPVETIVEKYPSAAQLTFLDTTPSVHGTNTYTITTTSALGAVTTVVKDLVTTECKRAYLSKGQGFSQVVVFGGNLSVKENLSAASTTVQAAGRTKPIGMYGVETSLTLAVTSFVYDGFGSTKDQLRAILLTPGKACYRDASGRRVFGTAKGSVAYKRTAWGDFSFNMTETS